MEISDKILIKRLNGGDANAFNAVYQRYHTVVLQLGMRFLPYKEDAEEVVQLVFIAVWENRKKIDENRNLASYILSIARHATYNALRKAVYRQGYMDYLRQNNPDFSFITEEVVLFNELEARLLDLQESMPPKRREIFRLHHTEGLSYKEISDRLSVSASTVNTQLTKALDFIRRNIRMLYKEV